MLADEVHHTILGSIFCTLISYIRKIFKCKVSEQAWAGCRCSGEVWLFRKKFRERWYCVTIYQDWSMNRHSTNYLGHFPCGRCLWIILIFCRKCGKLILRRNGKKGFIVTNKGIYSSGTKLLTKGDRYSKKVTDPQKRWPRLVKRWPI